MNNQSGKIPNQSKSPKGAAPPNAGLGEPAWLAALPLPLGLLPAASHCSDPPLSPSGICLFLSWGCITESKPHRAPELSVLTQEFGIHCKLGLGEHE